MKKVYVIVLSTITVLCIILGTLGHAGGWFGWLDFGIGSGKYVEYAEEQPKFQSLEIEADVMSVTIQQGDSYHISYKASEKLRPKIELRDDTLVVTQSSKGFNLWGNKKCEMTLTVPEGIQLDNAKFTMDVGDMHIRDLFADHINISADVGNVEMSSCKARRLEAEADVGNIDFRSCDFADTQIETDVGNVYFSTSIDLSQYNIALATDIGKVTVDGSSHKRNFNQTATDNTDSRRLTVETDTGNIEIATVR